MCSSCHFLQDGLLICTSPPGSVRQGLDIPCYPGPFSQLQQVLLNCPFLLTSVNYPREIWRMVFASDTDGRAKKRLPTHLVSWLGEFAWSLTGTWMTRRQLTSTKRPPQAWATTQRATALKHTAQISFQASKRFPGSLLATTIVSACGTVRMALVTMFLSLQRLVPSCRRKCFSLKEIAMKADTHWLIILPNVFLLVLRSGLLYPRVTESDLELLILFTPLPECCVYRYVPGFMQGWVSVWRHVRQVASTLSTQLHSLCSVSLKAWSMASCLSIPRKSTKQMLVGWMALFSAHEF